MCGHDVFKIASYIKDLSRVGMWPIGSHDHSVIYTLDKSLSLLEHRDLATDLGINVDTNSPCTACRFNPKDVIKIVRARIDKAAAGLCLDCARSGCERAENCRVDHKGQTGIWIAGL